MTPSEVIRQLAKSKIRKPLFAKCDLADFPNSALAAVLLDVYSYGGSCYLNEVNLNSRRETNKLEKMGYCTITQTPEKGANHKHLMRVELTLAGFEKAKFATETINRIINKIEKK